VTETVGPDKVKQTDKVMLTSVTQKYKLSKGYKHRIVSLISKGVTYEEGIDFKVESTKSGDSFLVWTYFEGDAGRGVGTWGWFPSGGNFQDKSEFPNGAVSSNFGWSNVECANTVILTNEGLQGFGQSTSVGALPPFTRTEYANNFRFGTQSIPMTAIPIPPARLIAKVRPAYRTGLISSYRTGFGMFYGEGLILYGNPCDFIGIGGYDVGCVDACPSPAGTDGALTQMNTFEGSARIYQGRDYSNSPTIKVFRVQSTLDGSDVTISSVSNSGGNIRVTTAAAHGYSVGDIIYFEGGTGTYVKSGSLNYIFLDKEGFRVTATPGANTFEIDGPDPATYTWNFGAPWGTCQKVVSCTAEYWDSGLIFPDGDMEFAIVQSEPAGSSSVYSFFYNRTGAENDWKKLGPDMSEPMGYNNNKVIVGSYMGGHFNLSGTAGTFSSNKSDDATNHMTTWRIIENSCPYYTWPNEPTNYKTIPIFDEVES